MGVLARLSAITIASFIVDKTVCVTFENVNVTVTNVIQHVSIENGDFLKNYINFTEADELTIYDQSLPTLEANSLGDLPRIHNIRLNRCGIKEIEAGAFKNLPPLEILSLAKNEIEAIKDGVFNGLKIGILYLDTNKISKIADKAFNNMELQSIYLSDNRISKFNGDWFLGTSVPDIHIDRNNLEELPEDTSKYLRENATEDTVLNLSAVGNKIRKIHRDALRGVTRMEFLDLQGNFIEDLEPSLFDDVSLVDQLVLKFNKISEIPVGLFKNTTVNHFHLQSNNLKCISPESINNTYYVTVEGNPFTCDCVKILRNLIEANEVRVPIGDFHTVISSC